MQFFKSKLLTFLLFTLISLGQAYPFSVAYGMFLKNKPAVCCCHQTEDRCHCPHQHAKKTITHSCHEEKGSGYKPLCGGKTQNEILSFNSEPFLKGQLSSFSISLSVFYLNEAASLLHPLFYPPLLQPPKYV